MVDTEYSIRNQLSQNHNSRENPSPAFSHKSAEDENSQKHGNMTSEFQEETDLHSPIESHHHHHQSKDEAENETDSKKHDNPNLSSSSASSGSLSPSTGVAGFNDKHLPNQSTQKPFQPLPGLQIAAEWYKQYEDRLMNQRSALFAGLHNLKAPGQFTSSRMNSPNQQSSPLPANTSSSSSSSNQTTPSSSSNDSSLLMERFYSQLPGGPLANGPHTGSQFGNIDKQQQLLAQQALLTQYAQQFYGNGQAPAALLPLLSGAKFNPHSNHHNQQDHSTSSASDSDKDRYLAQLNMYHQNMTSSTSSPFQQNNGNHHGYPAGQRGSTGNQNESPATPSSNASSSNSNGNNAYLARMIGENKTANNSNHGNNSSGSRSPSPASSQLSGHVNMLGCDEDDCDEYDDSQSINAANGEWTYEEQFKQLYELSDDPKRKDFLDDLFAFMQKRGSPVNRIPIMAKHVLDLYELYRLVVAKGGLVEVINKKLWREITKGLNLPSSITSAAFTLRTQYMKYLYPYECEKLKMSSPNELQAAIDGNRREGRRPIYGFEYSSPTGMGSAMSGPGIGGIGALPNQGLGMKPDMMASHPGLPHHPGLLQHPHNPQQAAFFAALAAQQNHLFDNPSSGETGMGHHNNQMGNPLSGLMPIHPGSTANIPSFLKPFYNFDMNTPPSSSSSSTSSSSSAMRNNTSENSTADNKGSMFNQPLKSAEQDNSENKTQRGALNPMLGSMKRPFDHLDQNQDSIRKPFFAANADAKEPLAKRLQLDCTLAGKNRETSYSASLNQINANAAAAQQASKMKIKILSKDATDLSGLASDKAITLSIELNGMLYKGTLFSNEASSDLGVLSRSLTPTVSTSTA